LTLAISLTLTLTLTLSGPAAALLALAPFATFVIIIRLCRLARQFNI
jgi:hypothetical protein